jgi:threonylcarbamoyladenosine tRNA methylthiotransferase MtaB
MMREHLCRDFDLVQSAADVYVVNACTVTSLAERKARQAIRRLRRGNPSAKIVLIGCLADAVLQRLTVVEEVDLYAGNAWKGRITEAVKRALADQRGTLPSLPPSPLSREHITGHEGRVRTFLKIQDGCDLSCTYCRTRQVRGSSRSKSIAAAVFEAQQLVENGYPEIVLTGINLAQYAPPDGNLPALVRAMLKIKGLHRLRLGSINPAGITEALLQVFTEDRRACPHFHIPLQSGDDAVLAHMKRGYDLSYYRSRIALAQRYLPRTTFGTDIIVGFPGEDQNGFARTCEVVEEVGFANLHIFRYSPRRGTPAAIFPNSLPEWIKRERVQRLQTLGATLRQSLFTKLIGNDEEVLIEEMRGCEAYGYTRGYLHAVVRSEGHMEVGDEIAVRITRASGNHLEGIRTDGADPR